MITPKKLKLSTQLICIPINLTIANLNCFCGFPKILTDIRQTFLPPYRQNHPNHIKFKNIMSDTSCNISNELAKYI